MKKIFFLLIALLASLMTYAYDVTNFFTAYSADGKYYLLDSVKIDNVTQGWSRTIDCSADTSVNYSVQPTSPTGIDDVMASSSENGLISDYRNYLSSHRFAVNIDRAGLLSIRAIDMLGRTLVRHDEYCAEGSYHFQLSLSQTQPFILSVTTANASEALMLLNTSNTGYNSIACENREPIRHAPLQQESEYKLCEGDKINYTGYSHRKGQVIVSQVVTIYLRLTDELIFFIFQSAVHSDEGSYVGLIGFNNQLYSKQIGLLMGSNLSQYTSFIDNLSTANGTILAHAVNGALDSLELSPIPTKLNDVTLVTFTDGLDVGSWRMNKDYSSSAQYLQAVSNRIGRTYIDGSLLTSYAIGIKGSDVTDEERFDNDLKNLASDPSYVFNVKDMTEVRRKFRDIAAKIYHTYISYSLLLSLPAPDPDSRIRLTFDNISDAGQSEYYLEGTYTFGDFGVLNNVSYCGVRCANGATLISYPDGMFDIFVLHNLETNLGERIVASNVKQWYYIPSTGKWQINSEFTPASGVTVTEDRNSAIIMLVLDCSSSLSSNFSSIKSYAKEFLNVLAGKTTFSKPSVSANAPILGKLSATCGGKIIDDKGMSILEKGICFSENGNMDNATYYAISSDDYDFDIRIDGLTEGKTYYYHAYARNEVGIAYSERQQFTAIVPVPPTVQTTSIFDITTHSASFEGKVIADGYAPITECGFCWSTSSNPTIDDNTLVLEASTGTFSGNVTELQDGTTYYVRAYAKNESGVGYGEELSFTTIAILPPTVSLLSTTIMAANYGAQCQGKVTNDGNSPIIECGFCWGTSPNPTIEDNYIVTDYSSDKFIANISNLLINTEYYVRAYAKNEKEIGYSEVDATKNIYICAIQYSAPQKLNEVTGDNAAGLHVNRFGATIQLHDFENGVGTIVFAKKCTSIGDNAFYNCGSLKFVTIPNSVTSIGISAFAWCEDLTSIEIPNSVTSIGGSAFRCCQDLTSVTIPNSVTSIGNYAFYECYNLTSITIPNNVTSIGDNAFYLVNNIIYHGSASGSPWRAKSVNGFVDGYLVYGDDNKTVLLGCFTSATGEIAIPNSVTSIGDYAFYGCRGLTSVTIGNSVTSIGNSAFYGCGGLTSMTIGNSVTSIGVWALSWCDNLTSIIIPNSVTSIGDYAFSNCSGLTSVTIPNSVKSIGNYAFEGCSLNSVTINSNAIVSKTYTTSYNLRSIFGGNVIILCDSVTSIGDYAFYNGSGLTSVTIPNSVKSIGNYAFEGCSSLTSITIPNSITSIGEQAFRGCKSLTSIEIPNSVTSIGNNAFSYCDDLSVTINSNAIVSKTYTLSNRLYYIFGPNVKDFILGDNVTSIGDFAFHSYTGLTSVTIGNSVTSIGENAFSWCENLISVTIGNNVDSIGAAAFDKCEALTSIIIPNSVTNIGNSAFSRCSGLTAIEIPNSVTSIENYAFKECSSLRSVKCAALTPPTCGTKVFYNVTKSIPLYVPSESINAYRSASQWKDFTNILPISE